MPDGQEWSQGVFGICSVQKAASSGTLELRSLAERQSRPASTSSSSSPSTSLPRRLHSSHPLLSDPGRGGIPSTPIVSLSLLLHGVGRPTVLPFLRLPDIPRLIPFF